MCKVHMVFELVGGVGLSPVSSVSPLSTPLEKDSGLALTDDASIGLLESIPHLGVQFTCVVVTSDPGSNCCWLSFEKTEKVKKFFSVSNSSATDDHFECRLKFVPVDSLVGVVKFDIRLLPENFFFAIIFRRVPV